MTKPQFLVPDWPVTKRVKAFMTTRTGGVSRAPYDSLNLAGHVGDRVDAVAANRTLLRHQLQLPGEPVWLRQVHGIRVIDASRTASDIEADGSCARAPGQVCAVLTADCLPVLLADRQGSAVAALHAGWRGLAAGVVEAGVGSLGVLPDRVCAWLGPAIGPDSFEVGDDVRSAFLDVDPSAGQDFRRISGSKYHADLYALARRRLAAAGVTDVYGGGGCTVRDPDRFFSFRRDGVTGRMAALIWMES